MKRFTGVQRNVVVEVAALATLTLVFLLVFPERTIFVEVGLAGCALALVGLNARYTKHAIWGQFRCPLDRRSRLRKAIVLVGPATGVLLVGLFAIGLALGYRDGEWQAAMQRVGNWRLILALVLYLPWALLQQTLFQFYLLGRLRTLFPAGLAIIFAGVAFGLVHLPDIEISLAAGVAGVFWSSVYDRYRVLSPLAVSQALLGSAFYYWVFGHDLVAGWTPSV